MIYDNDGNKLGVVRQSRSGRYYIRYPDGTCTPAKWRTYPEALAVLRPHPVRKFTPELSHVIEGKDASR